MSMHLQFAADVLAQLAAVQRPITQPALVEGPHAEKATRTTVPSWSFFGELGAPVAAHSETLRSGRAHLRVATARVIVLLQSPEVALPWTVLSSGGAYAELCTLPPEIDFLDLRRIGVDPVSGSGGGRR